MRKLFVTFLLLVFSILAVIVAGEKRVVGTRINNQIMLLRVDLANYAMDASADGVNWSAIPGTSGEFVINDNDLSLAKLVQIPTASILGNVSGSTGNVTTLSASDIKTLIGEATTSVSGLMSATDKTTLGTRAASGANSDITSLSGLTTALSVAQGGTGLSSLGTAGQVLAVNSGANGTEWITVSGSGTGDVTGPSSSTDSNLVTFDGTTGKIIKDSGVSSSSFATAGANSNITSLTGLTTALSVTQGGTGLNSLGTAGQVLTVNSDATGLQFANPSSGIDLSTYGASENGHYTRFSYSSGGIDEYTTACLHFDDSVTDAAGHWGTATVTGTASYVTGKFSKAFHFDAASGYGPVIYPYNASYFDFNDTQKITFEFWIKTTDISNDAKYVFAHAGDPKNGDTRFHFNFESGVLTFYSARSDVNGGVPSGFTFGNVSNGEWHHCAVTYNGAGTVKTWLDGSLVTTGSFNCRSAGAYGGDGFAFGSNHYGTPGVGAVFDLDEVRMTIGEERYTDTFTPPVAPFSAGVTRALYVDSLMPPYIAAPSSPAQGDILYYSGSAWAKLAAGTSGQYLQTQGAGANPIWATVTGTGGLLKASGSGYALDNGSTGRGTVGTKAVSLEYSDAGSGYGATGDNATVSGGISNTASGEKSTIGGGVNNVASVLGATVGGGIANTASGSASTVSGGNGNGASGYCSTVSGGEYNSAGGKYSYSGGYRAKTSNFAEFSFASGRFSENGDCQRGSVQARISTSSTDAAILYLDGSSARFTLLAGDHYSCRIHILGAQADGSTGDYYALVKIKNVSGTTSLSGTVRVIEAWEGDANLGTPTIAITADDTNDCLKIAVTPANATATRWTAVVEYVKINY